MAQLAAVSPGLSLASLHAELARLEQDALRLAAPPAAATEGAAGHGFAHSLAQALHGVDAKDQAAGARIAAVESGESDDLVGAMLASQEASLSFSMLLQVRNKVVGAVDELIKMQL